MNMFLLCAHNQFFYLYLKKGRLTIYHFLLTIKFCRYFFIIRLIKKQRKKEHENVKDL